MLIWVLPATVFFQMSAAVRLSSRHFFPRRAPRGGADQAGRRYTHGIFLGDPAPKGRCFWAPCGLMAWLRWGGRLLGVHLPARLLVLVGDGPCHDVHHDYPCHKDWPNYPFVRADAVAHPGKGRPPLTEVWGLSSAIQASFISFSEANPRDYDPRRGPRLTVDQRYAAIED